MPDVEETIAIQVTWEDWVEKYKPVKNEACGWEIFNDLAEAQSWEK